MRIAVVGTGIAGNAAAWALSQQYHVTVYDRELRPGGHSHTVTIDYDGTPVAVDIGFIVYNELNYPDLTSLFAHLGVETIESTMDFAVTADNGRFEWKGCGKDWWTTAKGLFAQPKNLLSPSYLWMLHDILAFNEKSTQDRNAGVLRGLSLGDYFALRKFAPRLLTDYLAPMGAAIWSAPANRMMDFPAENFVGFFDNHRLLQYDRPVWRTVKGGSKSYVEKLTKNFSDLRLGCAVTSIVRTGRGVTVTDSHGRSETYDHVVVASHSDQALGMLADASAGERTILGGIRYAPNTVYLHRDPRLMPKRKRAWASWNFLRWQRQKDSTLNDVAVTYWMNALQGISHDKPLFVSLNPPFEPDPSLTFGRYLCEHPQYDTAAFAAQERLGDIQGKNHTWFCGAWTGYGFHEDGLRSGLAVAESLGAVAPWRAPIPMLAEAAE